MLIATSKIQKPRSVVNSPQLPVLSSIKKDVARKKRKYERILSEESILVISVPGSFVGKTSQRVVVKEKRRKIKEIPFYRLKNILITSYGVSISSNLVKNCIEENIPIIFFDSYGRPYAHILSPQFPFYKLGMAQLSAVNDRNGIYLAKSFVEGKIRNQINLIKYYRKYKARKEFQFSQECEEGIGKMQALTQKLAELGKDNSLENLRPRIMNIEGQAASYYWSLIKYLLSNDVYFEGRERRSAIDLVNSLLNYGYGILYSQVYRSIILAGLNPNISFFA